MSTRVILLPTAAEFPATNYPELGQDAQLRFYLGFDTTTAESCNWTFVAPQGLTGTITAVVTYRAASATSGTACFSGELEAISDGDTVDTDSASSFATVNTPSAVTVPGTAGYIDQLSITLTNDDSIAAGDYCRFRLTRAVASDTATGDLQVLSVEIRDAA
jgi:hypothetical protein